jgi:small conductance mechanosensitive channel
VSLDVDFFRRMIEELVNPRRAEAFVETLIAIVIVVVVVHVTLQLSVALLRRWVRPDDTTRPAARQAQVRTLVPLLESVLRYTFYFTGLVMILDRLRLNVAALLASAGIVGIAIGFGAQPLIRDIIAGFFLLFEGLIQVGDVVRVGEATGEVERVNLRTTQIRKYSGELVTIPNGQIQLLGNMNRDFMRAMVQISLDYAADVQRAMALMHEVGQQWASEHTVDVLGQPEVQGITEFGTTGIQIRLVVMVRPKALVLAERELRIRLKAAFDAAGIELPYPRHVVMVSEASAGVKETAAPTGTRGQPPDTPGEER